MKKTILMLIVLLQGSIIAAPPLELHGQKIQRVPAFVYDIYAEIKESAKQLASYLSYLPELLYQQYYPHHAYDDKVAKLRYSASDDVADEEKKYLARRYDVVSKSCQTVLQQELPDEHLPRIALCFSGGGFRSMLMTLGFLSEAEKLGLLDMSLYVAGLSGSTWAIGGWMASQKKPATYIKDLTPQLHHGLNHLDDPTEIQDELSLIVGKMMTMQQVSVFDVIGSIMANTILPKKQKDRISCTLTETHQHIADGSHPFPIYTTVDSSQKDYTWLEVTPFEVGYSKYYIPTWAYGRTFKKGVSTNFVPEQTLGYFLGVFGSAFCINLKEAVDFTIDKMTDSTIKFPTFLKVQIDKTLKLLYDADFSGDRFMPATMPNFTYKQEGCSMAKQAELELVDGGFAFNFPIPPLLRASRDIDVIIMYDASYDKPGVQLRRASEYARDHGLKFPKISMTDIDKRVVSVFASTDKDTPTVIYFPMIKNADFSASFDPYDCTTYGECDSVNFDYSQGTIDNLTGLARFNLNNNFEVIKTAIAASIKKKALPA